MIGSNTLNAVLFTRANIDSISERSATYITQRNMPPEIAWKQAIEDEAQLIEHKLELMEEGALVWDWQGQQLSTMRRELRHITDHWEAVGT